jgi:sulfur carrier protein ThiS
MAMLNMPAEDSYLVSVNGTVLTNREAYASTSLRDGDQLAILPPIRGG